MALTAYTVMQSLNENSAIRYRNSVPPMEFAANSLLECGFEMDHAILCEAVDYLEGSVTADGILAETTLRNPDRVVVLSENVFTTIRDALKKFFDKLIAAVKGIIDKLKAAYFKMSKQTDKWLSLMKPKIQEAQGREGSSNAEAECFEWDSNFVLTNMKDKFSAIESAWQKETEQVFGAGVDIQKTLTKVKSDLEKGRDQHAGDKADDSAVKSVVTQHKDTAKRHQDALADFERKFPTTVAGALGGSGSTVDAILTSLAKQARGGKTEKSTRKYGTKVNDFMNAIEKSTDAINDIKDEYDKHLEHLTDFRSKVEEIGKDLESGDTGDKIVPGNVTAAFQADYKAIYDRIVKVTSMFEDVMGKVRTLNLKLVNEMVSEYMSLLSRFASYKAPKK